MTGRAREPRSPRRRLPEIPFKPVAVRRPRNVSGHPVEAPPPDRRNLQAREALRHRVRGEFEEMPAMNLTLPQACRLFALREDVCTRVLAELVAEGVIVRTSHGTYARRLAS